MGENVIINVTPSENGNLTLNMGNITIKQEITADVQKQFDFGILTVGSYKVNAIFNAGENYKVANNETDLVISPAKAEITDIQISPNNYGEFTYIKVESNVNGILTVNINNANKTFDFLANKLSSFNLGKFDAGTYDIDLTLDAGINYTIARNYTNVSINHKFVTVNINVNDNHYGDNVIINVSASESGWIDVTVGDIKKRTWISANNVKSVDFGILNAGLYNVSAKLEKNQNYVGCYDNATLLISPLISNIIDIQTFDYIYGDNIILNVKTDNDGILNATFDNIDKNFDMTSNVYSNIDFGIMNAGTYTVKLTFNAGINYDLCERTISVVIKPKATSIIISVGEYHDNENVVINVTSSESGKFTVKLGSIVKNINSRANEMISIDFGVLNNGSYVFDAYFTSGANFIDSHDSKNICVLSKIDEDNIAIFIPEMDSNQENNIVVNLPSDAKGKVKLTIGDSIETFDVNNGVAIVKVPKFDEGNYNYVISYLGDEKYSSFSKSGSLTVNKQTTSTTSGNQNNPSKPVAKTTLTLKTVKIKKSAKKLVLQATLKQGTKFLSGKKITFKFNGKTYKATTNKKGVAKVTIKKNVLKKLKVGKKIKIQASYGDAIAKKTVKVKK